MKDFFDIYYLSLRFTFEANRLAAAIKGTFENRMHTYEEDTLNAVIRMASDSGMRQKWKAFLKRLRLRMISFQTVLEGINAC